MVESRPVGINRRVAGSSDLSGWSQSDSLMFWVYILENPSGRFYVGQTGNLQARLSSHNRADKVGGKFARKHGPWQMVWSEGHPTRASAMAREREIKNKKSARWILDVLLNGRVPTGRD